MTDSDQELADRVRALRADFEAALAAAGDASALQGVQDRFLGRRAGQVTELLKSLGKLPAEARRDAGQLLNALKEELEGLLESARSGVEARARDERLRAERVDITLPARSPARGRRHPLTVAREDLEDIFVSMGYEVYDGPEVEDDYHCFEALNMPPDHPARDMQDTFYVQGRGDVLLRTHTSTAQIRYMLANPHPPYVRIICPGKVFRRDDDVTHSPMFQQIEALVVGPGITLGDLKGTVEAFLHALFGPGFPVRFRSSFFPYTEPSVEVDLGCVVCGGSGRLDGGGPCRVCKTTGWLEIMGSGVVHPAVFEAVNARLGRTVYDPEQVSGFAFGLGIDRVAMIRHGIDDIRLFYENDLRFLEQFPG
jgi:phenylalanyl-tRNA synthetase alpha chain